MEISQSNRARGPREQSKRCLELVRRLVARQPDKFRDLLHVGDDFEQCFIDVSQPWQNLDLQALDATWQRLAAMPVSANTTADTSPLYQRAYIERPRGHSKTTDMAVQIAWILQFARHPVSGLAAAADQDQARLILQSLRRLTWMNRWLLADLEFTQHQARNSETGSQLTVISSDVGSSYGVLADFIVCDELCHWPDVGLWNSLLSTAAKKPGCILTILTNAGVGRGWQWDVREHARKSADWYFSSLAGPQAPWITAAWLREQQDLLPGPVFRRLWLNEWQQSDGEFVTLAEATACCDESLSYQTHGRRGVSYVAAIDYAEKHDLTVGCVCHREGDVVIVDRMDVVRPTPTRHTSVSWVENWIREVAQDFHDVLFIVDEHQLLSVIQKLQGRYAMQRFEFRAGQGNHDLAVALRRHILERRVQWYLGCGALPSPADQHDGSTDAPLRDTLETELASLLLHQTSIGRIRIDHIRDGQHHDDRSFALGVCCLELPKYEAAYLHTTQPGRDGGFQL